MLKKTIVKPIFKTQQTNWSFHLQFARNLFGTILKNDFRLPTPDNYYPLLPYNQNNAAKL
ncbi:hypothetical protein SAMN03080594_101470 [Arenibacter palladensis]|uniref:Uncharacterized protein n=1 Tax=Arenibacter palladensis TaxID=237373 RepID=A0A1M4U2C6_9FLAO|nr:hypothetical protein SAMN03080594_101470 [Arenibacter palladensis]